MIAIETNEMMGIEGGGFLRDKLSELGDWIYDQLSEEDKKAVDKAKKLIDDPITTIREEIIPG